MIILQTQLLPMTRIEVLEAWDDGKEPLTITSLLEKSGLSWDPNKYYIVEQSSGVVSDPDFPVRAEQVFFLSLRLLCGC